MFSYYGSKSKIINYYPPPKHGLIIEPFAGSARYALRWCDRDVILVDKYQRLVDIWLWLQSCSPNDILGLPKLKTGQRISECKEMQDYPDAAKDFLGLLIGRGGTSPRDKVSAFGDWDNQERPNLYKNISKKIPQIKHWKIICGSYEDIDNQLATWYIDPPYQTAGYCYQHSSKSIDYDHLGNWCKDRQGQVIVCENQHATWLPFQKLAKLNTSESINPSRKNKNPAEEWIWCNDSTLKEIQLQFF